MSFDWFTTQGVRLPGEQRQVCVQRVSLPQQHCTLHHTCSGCAHSSLLCRVILVIVTREEAGVFLEETFPIRYQLCVMALLFSTAILLVTNLVLAVQERDLYPSTVVLPAYGRDITRGETPLTTNIVIGKTTVDYFKVSTRMTV